MSWRQGFYGFGNLNFSQQPCHGVRILMAWEILAPSLNNHVRASRLFIAWELSSFSQKPHQGGKTLYSLGNLSSFSQKPRQGFFCLEIPLLSKEKREYLIFPYPLGYSTTLLFSGGESHNLDQMTLLTCVWVDFLS